MRAADYLDLILRKTRGFRQLTMAHSRDVRTWDVSSSGDLGHHVTHRAIFFAKLENLLHSNDTGSLIVREFTEVKVERVMPNGKICWIPIKNLYGFVASNGRLVGISAQSHRRYHETDHRTGELLEPELDVIYKDPLF